MAAMIAKTYKKKVLYVDCDPQCNATQLLLDDEVWTQIFAKRKDSTERTILHPLRYIREGDSAVDTNFHVERSKRFGIDVLAGHPGLAIVEDKFSSSWIEFKGGDDLGAARRTLWARALVSKAKYDYIFFDIGPSLGPLNRTVLLGSDYFVTPTSADLFSLYALDNIHEWMKSWIKTYDRAIKDLRSTIRESDSMEFTVPSTPAISSGYLGYTVQQYVSRSAAGKIRDVRAYDRYKKQIPTRVKTLMAWSASSDTDPDLGVVPNMFAMVPLAQSVHAPISELKSSDGVRGAQIAQNAKYTERLEMIAERIYRNLNQASP